MSFYSKNSQAMDRENKVQRLVIPFSVTASATPASVILKNDEPSLMFLKSEGVDQITAELTSLGDSATYSVSPNDANGILNIFIQVSEPIEKIMQANVIDRVNGGSQPCKLGDSDGLSSLQNIMLTMDSTINLSTTNADLCLIVEYVVQEN